MDSDSAEDRTGAASFSILMMGDAETNNGNSDNARNPIMMVV